MKRAQQRREREGGGRGTRTEKERERLRKGDKCRKQKCERKRARARSHARESISLLRKRNKVSEYSFAKEVSIRRSGQSTTSFHFITKQMVAREGCADGVLPCTH